MAALVPADTLVVVHEKHSRVVPAVSSLLLPHHGGDPSPALQDFPDHNDDPDLANSVILNSTSQLTRRSLSLLSRSSLRLLSQCSSLDSLPSLGLSFHGSLDDKLLKGDVTIEAECNCALTLKGQGEQVVVCDRVLYSASSSSHEAAMKAWLPKLVSAESGYFCSTDGSLLMKEGRVRAMAVGGDWLFSSHEDLKIRVWARPDKGLLSTNCPPNKSIAAIPTVWDCLRRAIVPGAYVQVRRNQRKSLWIQHVDAISALAVSRNNGFLYSASWDRSVKVWRLPDFKCMESFKAHDDAINALALSSDGFLYTGSADSTIKVWAILPATGELEKTTTTTTNQHMLVSTLAAHRSAVNALALSPDGSLLYSGACDKAIVVWQREASSQHVLGTHHATLAGALRGHRQAVLCLATVGTTLCSGSADKTVRVWHRSVQLGRIHTCIAVLEGHTTPVKSLSISSYETASCMSPIDPSTSTHFSLYSASLDQDIKLWSIKLSQVYNPLQQALFFR